MINELEIHNFKSIKDLTLPCKRFNLFIGEPNTGKSNILEALGLVSFIGVRQYDPEAQLDGFVRQERISNLFYEDEVANSLSIRIDRLVLSYGLWAGRTDGSYLGEVSVNPETRNYSRLIRLYGDESSFQGVDYGGYPGDIIHPNIVRFYRFPFEDTSGQSRRNFLLPPFGANLPALLLQSRELRTMANLPFLKCGLRLGLRPQENRIEVIKEADDIIISYSYGLVSDTLKRITFYTAAIETNQNAVIVLEEPEAHSFPGETKILAEQIAMDENGNQYFIVTHNPYFLMPLLSKAPKDDIAINIVYSEDYQTKVRPLAPEELPELFEINIFANLKRYLEE